MAKKKKSRQVRAEFRKKHDSKKRKNTYTADYHEHGFVEDDSVTTERVSGKGDLTRRRTITGEATGNDDAALSVQLDIDESAGLWGRVISVHGRDNMVRTTAGDMFRCTTRGILKSLVTDQRHVVAAGDHVFITTISDDEGVIERAEPRSGVISRTSRGKQHVIVANVQQLVIIATAAEPELKPNLIDRFLITAEKTEITPLICINKADLVDVASLQPILGVYGRMGYRTLVVSAKTGYNIERFKQLVTGVDSVVAGQSGVGKSSLLNVIENDLHLRVREVSEENQKGKHTTTAAQLYPLSGGGHLIDTPGIRQFELWDVIPEEVANYFRDIRPYVSLCKFPDCTHTHEDDCEVKYAVADGKIDLRRYDSYLGMFLGDAA